MECDISKSVKVEYFASLREESGLREELHQTDSLTAAEIYDELRHKHQFSIDPDLLRVAVNDEFQSWDTVVEDGDLLVFIQPVAGG